MTRAEFAAGMAYLGAGIGKPVPAMQMEVYWDLLGHLDYEIFQLAARKALLGITENFLPAAGAIYRHACDILIARRGEQERQHRILADRRNGWSHPAIGEVMGTFGEMPAAPRRNVAEVRRLLSEG
jgi:hypothetical protein